MGLRTQISRAQVRAEWSKLQLQLPVSVTGWPAPYPVRSPSHRRWMAQREGNSLLTNTSESGNERQRRSPNPLEAMITLFKAMLPQNWDPG